MLAASETEQWRLYVALDYNYMLLIRGNIKSKKNMRPIVTFVISSMTHNNIELFVVRLGTKESSLTKCFDDAVWILMEYVCLLYESLK